MFKTYITIIALALLSVQSFAQQIYTSNNNSTSNWTDFTWSKSQTWMEDRPRYAGNNNAMAGYGYWASINLYGYITRNGDLTVDGGGALNVYDTLRITGNLYSQQTINVHPGGILIVEGDYITNAGGQNNIDGTVVVLGSLSASGGSAVDVAGDFYLFETLTSPGDGERYNGSGTPPTGYFQDEDDLAANNSSLYNFATTGTLPVEFVYLNAQTTQDGVLVQWATASELNNDYFTIERSQDGVNYSAFRTVDGAGNSEDIIAYQIIDGNAFNGTNYYRVKQTDYDGQFDYSGVAVVFNDAVVDLKLNVYPNPSTDMIHMDISKFGKGNMNVNIFDSNGNVVYNKDLTDSMENILTVDVSSFSKGIYVVNLTSNLYSLTNKLLVR